MSELVIKPVTEPSAWEAFLRSLQPNTFLQSWEWGQVQLQTGEGVHYLGFYRGQDMVGVALIVVVNARRGRFYLCPHGPLLREQESIADVLHVLVQYLRAQGQRDKVVAIRIAPLLEATPDNRKVFVEGGFRPAPLHVHTELTWVLDLTPAEDLLMRGMRKTTRHAIRRAQEHGVDVEIFTEPSALARFMPLYQETKQRHAFIPFSEHFLRTQVTAFGQQGRFFMAIARYQGRDVAAALLVHYGNTVFYHHGASTPLPATVPAAQLLQWRAIQEAKRRGATRYNFWGIAPADQPRHPFAGITVFKKGFGGYAIDYLHAQDLPLTTGYWQLWLVDMVRKWRRGF